MPTSFLRQTVGALRALLCDYNSSCLLLWDVQGGSGIPSVRRFSTPYRLITQAWSPASDAVVCVLDAGMVLLDVKQGSIDAQQSATATRAAWSHQGLVTLDTDSIGSVSWPIFRTTLSVYQEHDWQLQLVSSFEVARDPLRKPYSVMFCPDGSHCLLSATYFSANEAVMHHVPAEYRLLVVSLATGHPSALVRAQAWP